MLLAMVGAMLGFGGLGFAGEASAQAVPTLTTLAVNTTTLGGKTQAHATVTVTDEDGNPAAGTVAIEESGRQLAGAALNGSGQATAAFDLPGGEHLLRAVYAGDASHQPSVSDPQASTAPATSAPDFQITVSALQPSSTLSPGAAGTATVTLTPVNNAALTAPMFITVSCSGLPNQTTCTFTPETLEIDATTTTPPTSSMVIQTVGPGTSTELRAPARPGRRQAPIAWAFVLPGVFGLGGLAWGTRRRRWLSRTLLLVAVCVVTTLGASGCNPQYYYYNHGQVTNPPTPAGTYTVTVTAQSSNGITAITNSTTLALTVQ